MKWPANWKPHLVNHSLVMSEQDLEAYPCWYLDEAHSIPPWTPLFVWSWVHGNRYGDLWAAEAIGLPRCHGTDWREVDGCAYMSPVLVTDEQGTKVETVPKEKQAIPCLSDEELTHLVKLAKQVELHYGGIPQDIEWAVDAELPFPENIFLIQARPVVVPSPPSRKLNKPPGKGDTEHIADLLIERFHH